MGYELLFSTLIYSPGDRRVKCRKRDIPDELPVSNMMGEWKRHITDEILAFSIQKFHTILWFQTWTKKNHLTWKWRVTWGLLYVASVVTGKLLELNKYCSLMLLIIQ